MSDVPATTPRPRYAQWPERVLCWAIDLIVPALIVLVGTFLAWPQTTTEQRTFGNATIDVTVTSGFGALFYVFLIIALGIDLYNRGYREGITGSSYGKGVMGFRTVHQSTGANLGPVMGVARAALLWADFAICYVGVLWPLWDVRRQTLISDKVATALVIRKAPQRHS